MRKLVLGTVLFLLLSPGEAFAERAASGKRLGLWLFGGFSFSGHKGQGLDAGVNSVTGMAFGLGVDYKLTNEISVELNILDVWKGYEVSTPTTVTQYNLAYFEVPFLLKWSPATWFSLKLGPYLAAFIMEAEREEAGTSGSVKGDFRNDFGMTAGMWFGFQPTKAMTIGLDTRYDYGFRSILDTNEPSQTVHTRTLITMVTVSFQLK